MATPTTEEKQKIVNEILDRVFKIDVHSFFRRSSEVLHETLIGGKTFKETSKAINLPLLRVKQIFPQAVRTICAKLDNLKDEIKIVEERKNEIQMLKEKISHYEEKERKCEEAGDKLATLPKETQKLLFRKIYELDISVRAFNVCKNNDIDTLMQLVKLDRHEFLQLRNAGKKTANELEQFFASKGLHWNMDL